MRLITLIILSLMTLAKNSYSQPDNVILNKALHIKDSIRNLGESLLKIQKEKDSLVKIHRTDSIQNYNTKNNLDSLKIVSDILFNASILYKNFTDRRIDSLSLRILVLENRCDSLQQIIDKLRLGNVDGNKVPEGDKDCFFNIDNLREKTYIFKNKKYYKNSILIYIEYVKEDNKNGHFVYPDGFESQLQCIKDAFMNLRNKNKRAVLLINSYKVILAKDIKENRDPNRLVDIPKQNQDDYYKYFIDDVNTKFPLIGIQKFTQEGEKLSEKRDYNIAIILKY